MVNSLKVFLNWLQKPINLFLFLLSLVPIAAIVVFIAVEGVNVPYLDQWGTSATIAIKTADSSLTFHDLISLHGDHRIFFSKLLTVIVTLTTRWNTKVEMYVSVLLAAVNLVLLVFLFKLDHSEAKVLVIVPFSLLIFSFRQSENWLWGFETCWFFVSAFIFAALLVLKRFPVGWRPIAVASFFSLCATYSFGSGVLAWPILLVMLLLLGYTHWKYIGFWVVSAALTILIFLKDYSFGSGTHVLFDVGALVRFIISYLGSPLMPATGAHSELLTKPWLVNQSMVIGICGTLLFLVNLIYLRKLNLDWKQLAGWLALAGYSLGGSVITALARASFVRDFYPHQSLLSRYVTGSTPLWIALVSLIVITVWRIAKNKNPKPWETVLSRVNIFASVLIIVLYISANFNALIQPPRVSNDQKECMLNYPASRKIDCLAGIVGINLVEKTDTIWQLAIHRLSAFAESKDLIAQKELTQPNRTANDYEFNITDSDSWSFSAMVPEESEGGVEWVVGNGPHMVFTQPLDICLSDYTHFMIVMSVSPGIHTGASYMHIFYQLNDQKQYEEPISIAVQPDEVLHEYTFDLKILNLDPQARMSRFRFDPIVRGSLSGDTVVKILDLRLIRGSEPSLCTD